MLGKLLKYDLKWIYKLIVVYYCLALVFAAIGRCFSLIDGALIFDILGKISCGTSVAMMFNILINNVIRIWVRYIQNVYKDESYLTHTLPVKKSDIYLSKLLSALITISTSVIVIFISFILCYWNDGFVEFIKMILPDSSWSIIVLTGVVLVFEIFFLVFLGLLGITIGYRSNYNKLLISFVSGFGIYMISSFVSIIILFVVGLFNKDVLDLFTNMNVTPSMDVFKFIMWVAIVIYLAYIIICNIICNKLFQKGVNVD